MKALLLSLSLVCASCVTAEDIRKVSVEVANLENALSDTSLTVNEQEAAITSAVTELGNLATEVAEREEGLVRGVGKTGEALGLSGMVTTAGILALNHLRNRSRKRDLEVVTEKATTS